MAKIPVFTRQILPSGRTAGVPMPDVDIVGVGEARGLAILGRAISGLGETLFELGVRERMADDSLAVNVAGESRDLAQNRMKQFMLDNVNPSTWLEGARGVIDEQRTVFSEQKFSPRVLENEKIEQEAFESELLTGIQILTTERKIDIDIQVSGENLINKIATDDGSQLAQRDINKQTNLYRAALERRDPPEIAAIEMRETLRQAKKAFYIDQSKLRPDAIIAEMEKKKKALGRAGKDKEGLGSKDYDDIIASAFTAKALVRISLNNQQELDRDMLGKSLDDGTITYTKINSTSLDEKEQESYRIKMNSEAERKAKGIAIETDRRVKGELETMAWDLATGAASLPDFKKRLEDERYGKEPKIDDIAYGQLKSLSETKFAAQQAEAMKGRNTHSLTQLVTLPSEEAFAEMLARLTSKFDKERAQTLRQLQLDNWDRYKKALRDWLKENKDATGDEIYEEGRSILVHYRKSPDQLRKEAAFIEGFKFTESGFGVGLEIAEGIIPTPKTQAEYDALPSGTKYKHPDGTIKIKK